MLSFSSFLHSLTRKYKWTCFGHFSNEMHVNYSWIELFLFVNFSLLHKTYLQKLLSSEHFDLFARQIIPLIILFKFEVIVYTILFGRCVVCFSFGMYQMRKVFVNSSTFLFTWHDLIFCSVKKQPICLQVAQTRMDYFNLELIMLNF